MLCWVPFLSPLSKLRIRSGGADNFSVITEHGEKVAAFLFEPIQGEAGVSL
jgi:acetylornithine/succinyldiaminopimelate/putrescine aminotransferase